MRAELVEANEPVAVGLFVGDAAFVLGPVERGRVRAGRRRGEPRPGVVPRRPLGAGETDRAPRRRPRPRQEGSGARRTRPARPRPGFHGSGTPAADGAHRLRAETPRRLPPGSAVGIPGRRDRLRPRTPARAPSNGRGRCRGSRPAVFRPASPAAVRRCRRVRGRPRSTGRRPVRRGTSRRRPARRLGAPAVRIEIGAAQSFGVRMPWTLTSVTLSPPTLKPRSSSRNSKIGRPRSAVRCRSHSNAAARTTGSVVSRDLGATRRVRLSWKAGASGSRWNGAASGAGRAGAAGVAPAAFGNRPGECRGRSGVRLGGEEAPVGGSRPGAVGTGRARRGGRRFRPGRRSDMAGIPAEAAARGRPHGAGRPRHLSGRAVPERVGMDARISGRVPGGLPLVGCPAGSRCPAGS